MKNNEDKLSDKEKLEQENLLMKAKISLQGGIYNDDSQLDPAIENQFLNNIFDFENAEQKPQHEILGINPSDFPPANQLSEKELKAKFDLLLEIMEQHNYQYSLVEKLPLHNAYEYLAGEFLTETGEVLPEGWTHNIDGCSGDCPSCFQADYCKSIDDIWPPEELEAERKRRKEEGL